MAISMTVAYGDSPWSSRWRAVWPPAGQIAMAIKRQLLNDTATFEAARASMSQLGTPTNRLKRAERCANRQVR